MSLTQPNDPPSPCPPTREDLRRQLHQRLDQLCDSCQHDYLQTSFFDFEKALLTQLSSLGLLLLQLFLLVRHQRLDLAACDPQGRYRVADDYAPRTLNTSYGQLLYGRVYLIPRRGSGPGWHPLDALLGLTRDCFTPLLVSWFCRLCTRLSYRLASELGGMFLGWCRPPPRSRSGSWGWGGLPMPTSALRRCRKGMARCWSWSATARPFPPPPKRSCTNAALPAKPKSARVGVKGTVAAVAASVVARRRNANQGTRARTAVVLS